MAHRPKVEQLSDRDYKALELFRNGDTNVTEVAAKVGMDPSNLRSLIRGNVEKMGNKASVFQREYARLVDSQIAESEKAVSKLSKNCEKMAFGIYQRQIKMLEAKAKLTEAEEKRLNNMTKAMAALKPSAPRSLKLSQTWNYTKGLTTQELEHEFSRLKGLAAGPPNAGGVSGPKQGGPGVLHPPSE